MNCRIAKRIYIFLFSFLLFSLSYAQIQFKTAQVDTQNGFFLSVSVSQIWSGDDWVDEWKCTYSYDGDYNCMEEFEQLWDGDNWVNDQKKPIVMMRMAI